MDLRMRESGGVSLGRRLVRADLRMGEPCGRPGCVLDKTSGGQGGPHNKMSSLYHGVCNICGTCQIEAEYWGETSRTGYYRTLQHEDAVVKKDLGNAFAKHLAFHHPDQQGDITNFTIQVVSSFRKPLPREKTEAVKIQSSKAAIILNSKAEHKQPKLHRVVMTRENAEPAEPVTGGGGRARGGGEGGRGGRRRQGGAQ